MNNTVLFLIIVCLCAIIPAGVAFIACWARQMSDGRRIEAAIEAAGAVKNIAESYERMQNLYFEQEKRVTTLAESFQNLTNKINSRQKVEQAQERRREKEQEPESPDEPRRPSPHEMENLLKDYPHLFAQPQPNNGGQAAQPKRMVIRPKSI